MHHPALFFSVCIRISSEDRIILFLLFAFFSHIPTQRNQNYNVVSRELETDELKALIDAVLASRYLSVEKSRHIVSLLVDKAAPTDRPYLEESLDRIRSVRKALGRTLYSSDLIPKAIMEKRKIRFCLVEYRTHSKEIIQQQNKKTYLVSPYATILVDGHYYLVAYDEKKECIITPRLDSIRKVKVLDKHITPIPESFDLSNYYRIISRAYDGKEMDIVIECENHLLGKFIDRFGTDFECVPVSDHSFRANVKTCIGNPFFGWMLQYAGEMKIIGPDAVVKEYKYLLKKAMNR